MLTRRIVISACALSLAIPAAAGASPATDPPKANSPDGITSTTYPTLVKAKGPYGMTPATHPKLVKAKGPYGTTLATSSEARQGQGPLRHDPRHLSEARRGQGPLRHDRGHQHAAHDRGHGAPRRRLRPRRREQLAHRRRL